ncbi:MAG: GFA family protein, partial [Myxococcota bacterium]|nr:GFA family protein [Myxococcota bacterium]
MTAETWLEGGCHCGDVRFRVAVRRWVALDCNCSICTRKGYLHLIVPVDDLVWLTGRDAVAEYTFGT